MEEKCENCIKNVKPAEIQMYEINAEKNYTDKNLCVHFNN